MNNKITSITKHEEKELISLSDVQLQSNNLDLIALLKTIIREEIQTFKQEIHKEINQVDTKITKSTALILEEINAVKQIFVDSFQVLASGLDKHFSLIEDKLNKLPKTEEFEKLREMITLSRENNDLIDELLKNPEVIKDNEQFLQIQMFADKLKKIEDKLVEIGNVVQQIPDEVIKNDDGNSKILLNNIDTLADMVVSVGKSVANVSESVANVSESVSDVGEIVASGVKGLGEVMTTIHSELNTNINSSKDLMVILSKMIANVSQDVKGVYKHQKDELNWINHQLKEVKKGVIMDGKSMVEDIYKKVRAKW